MPLDSLLFMLILLPAETAAKPPQPPLLEAFFEVKLLVRERGAGLGAELDQWAGGSVLLEGTTHEDGSIVYRIVEVLDDPWTFRWYPAKDEVKLGAAVWVEDPEGHPYGALEPELERLARERYAQWWDNDPAAPGPSWSAESGRFWAQRHSRETDEKDPLAEHPVYPFHVLGPIHERFGFRRDGSACVEIVERMSRPWLADGWSEALSGERVEGYGYWDAERPDWEPRVYETFAAALELLGPPAGEPVAAAIQVMTALQPRAAALTRRWSAVDRVGERQDVAGFRIDSEEGTVRGARTGTRYRSWRRRGADSDEAQVLIRDGGSESFKLWVRVGLRADPPRTP